MNPTSVTSGLRRLKLARQVAGPKGLSSLLEYLGPVYVKMGQYLALRPDILPQDYCDELLRLTDRGQPVSWDAVRLVVQEEFGCAPEDLFGWIDPTPVAAASLSQVHRARTFDGEDVAVKIQRPGIAAQVLRDLRTLKVLLRRLPAMGDLAVIDRAGLAEEIERWLIEELDLSREFSNALTLHEAARGRRDFRAPRPIAALSTRRVLTMEFFHGTPCSELMRLVAAGRGDDIAGLGIDRVALARNLSRAMLFQIFSAPLFHADPHPGNLIALADNVVGFVDVGIADHLDDRIRASQIRYVSAVLSGDTDRILYVLRDVLEFDREEDFAAFRSDFVSGMRRWRRERKTIRRGDHSRSPLANYMIQMMQSARRHGLRVPIEVLSMYRALLAVETVAARLGQDEAGLRQASAEFFTRLQLRTAIEQLAPSRVQAAFADIVTLVGEGPGQISRLLADLSDDRFVLRTQTSESEEDRRLTNRRTRVLAAAILFVGMAIAIRGLPDQRIVGSWTGHDLGLALLAAWLAIVAYLWVRVR